MKKYTGLYLIGIFTLIIVVVIGVKIFSINKAEISLGGVPVTAEYTGVTLGNNSAQGGIITNYPSTLGSVVMTGDGAGTLKIYNATTTNADIRTITATTSLPLLASFPASVDDGTYIFDIWATIGIIYEYVGVVGTTTITYR